MPSIPEILAPAGDADSLNAALAAGADAVYFGLDEGLNARARATNFSATTLRDTLDHVHRAGARAYVTLNTLVFENELPVVETLIRACALAGVEAPFGSEGRDLGPLLRGESAATGRPEVFTAYRHVQRSVRDGRWKLIEYPVLGRTQLFDLKRDPAELVDLSDHAAHREQLRRLLGSLREQQRQLGDPLAGP